MDYVLAAGFCVITFHERYIQSLRSSKLTLRLHPKILAMLNYVDPWYDDNSKDDFHSNRAAAPRVSCDSCATAGR